MSAEVAEKPAWTTAVLVAVLGIVLIGAGVVTHISNDDGNGDTVSTSQGTNTTTLSTTGTTTTTGLDPDTLLFDESLAWDHLVDQVEIGPRWPGTDGIEQNRALIKDSLEEYGWDVSFHNFTVNGVECANVLGTRGEPTVLIGAHFDTRFVADADPDPDRRDEPVLGANDGASGIAVQLELARVLTAHGIDDIGMVFFDAEDQGSGGMSGWNWIMGSQAFVDDGYVPATVETVIIIDMIGDDELNIPREGFSDAALLDEIYAVAAELSASGFVNQPGYHMLDDHRPFINAGYTAVDLIDFDYDEWHTVSDDLDAVCADSLGQVGRVLEYWIRIRS